MNEEEMLMLIYTYTKVTTGKEDDRVLHRFSLLDLSLELMSII